MLLVTHDVLETGVLADTVVGGRHRSAPGEVPAARADGPARRLVRQEVVGLVPAATLASVSAR